MVEKFNIEKKKLTQEEYSSDDFLLVVFSLLESKGYYGFLELNSLLNDSQFKKDLQIFNLIRLMGGMTLKIPPLSEVSYCLKTCVYIYYCLIKDSVTDSQAKIILNLTDDDCQDLKQEAMKWYNYILKEGYDLENFVVLSKTGNLRKQIKKLKKELKNG